MKNTENNKQKRSSLHLRGASGAQGILSLRSAVLAARDALILPTAKRHDDKCSGRSMIEMLEKVKQPLNAVLRRQAQVFRCCQLALAPRSNTENQVTEAPLGARQRQCALAQSGRSMIEMLGVLAIIGVLSVGGIAGYSKAMHRYRVNKTIDQITYMAGAIRTFFAPQKSYKGLHSSSAAERKLLKKAKLVPDEMWVEGENLPQSVWGNKVYIYSICRNQAEYDNGINKAFAVDYIDIPEEACIDLLTQDWTSAGVDVVNIADMYVYKLPIDLSEVIKVCADEDGSGIELMFYFDIDVNDEHWQEMLQYDYASGGY